ncbi:hypothetical protein D3C81_491320 [compost metagenome]
MLVIFVIITGNAVKCSPSLPDALVSNVWASRKFRVSVVAVLIIGLCGQANCVRCGARFINGCISFSDGEIVIPPLPVISVYLIRMLGQHRIQQIVLVILLL